MSDTKKLEDNGKDGTYYDVTIDTWTHKRHHDHSHNVLSYGSIQLCCNDIIEVLEMDYAVGNAFKALWRIAAARQGKMKRGGSRVYDAEKAVMFSERVLVREIREEVREGKRAALLSGYEPAPGTMIPVKVDKGIPEEFTKAITEAMIADEKAKQPMPPLVLPYDLKDSSVNIDNLCYEMQAANRVAAEVWKHHGKMLVVTSGNDSEHKKASKHYTDEACDYRTRYFADHSHTLAVANELRGRLDEEIGPNLFDVIVEKDHIHCEYDPDLDILDLPPVAPKYL